MTPEFQRDLNRFENVVRALMAIVAAGTARDIELATIRMQQCLAVRVKIFYSPANKPRLMFGGTYTGTFKTVMGILCGASSLTWPVPAEGLSDEDFNEEGQQLAIPGVGASVSAHQLIAAHALVSDALRQAGVTQDHIDQWLKPRAS